MSVRIAQFLRIAFALSVLSRVVLGASGQGEEWHIGPGDALMIQILGTDEPVVQAEVTPGGDIMFPYIGRVKAAGKTAKQLEGDLADLLRKGYFVDPRVAVVLAEQKSKKVLVLGEAQQPGEVVLVRSTTLVELLTKVGGATPESNGKITVIRAGDSSTPETHEFKIDSVMSGDKDSAFLLKPGDVILFKSPRSQTIYITGQVNKPGPYPMTDGLSVRQAIIYAGGMTATGSERRTFIVRKTNGKQSMKKVKMDDRVQDGDTIIVKEGWF